MGRKSAAQIRRLEKRAAQRGETYVPPADHTRNEDSDDKIGDEGSTSIDSNGDNCNDGHFNQKVKKVALRLQKELKEIESNADFASKDRRSAKRKAEAIAAEDSGVPSSELITWFKQNGDDQSRHLDAAKKLIKELKSINDNQSLKAKDRRSAKRKAEAISSEETGMPAEELLAWYETNKNIHDENDMSPKGSRRCRDPLIAFVGQLSYETTTDDLLAHICSNLSDDYPASKISEMTKIRLLTDPKTQKSRGMAFVEVQDPEFLYALLKLHQTYLKGRRINIERSAGGKKHSEKRKTKLDQYRKEQSSYFAEVVENILAEYKKTGELREDELDEGVITVCKRHAGPVVQAAVAEYIEKGGRDMNNPSAYLTFLVTKFAKEGVHDVEDTGKTKKNLKTNGKWKRSSGLPDHMDKKQKTKWNGHSEFEASGVDMSLSQQIAGSRKSTNREKRGLSKIFPSSQRGRGRGYMHNVR